MMHLNTEMKRTLTARIPVRAEPADAQAIAVHASSLWDGFVYRHSVEDLYRYWGAGGIELHHRMAEVAVIDAQLCEALYQASKANFPGVYTYEITESLGEAIAQHLTSTSEFPTDIEWQCALGELAMEFFCRRDTQVVESIRPVIAQFLPGWIGTTPQH